MSQSQVGARPPFTIERKQGKAPSTVIFRLCGPFTARSMYESLPPVALQNMLAFQSLPGEEAPVLNILDLTDVPYIDSSGLGEIVRHYVRCKRRGIEFFAAGAGPRVLELFKMTKVDSVIPMIVSVEAADVQAPS